MRMKEWRKEFEGERKDGERIRGEGQGFSFTSFSFTSPTNSDLRCLGSNLTCCIRTFKDFSAENGENGKGR